MKKYPRWVYLLAGALLAVGALYAYGKYKMKKDKKPGNQPQPAPDPAAPAPADNAKTLVGPVLRK